MCYNFVKPCHNIVKYLFTKSISVHTLNTHISNHSRTYITDLYITLVIPPLVTTTSNCSLSSLRLVDPRKKSKFFTPTRESNSKRHIYQLSLLLGKIQVTYIRGGHERPVHIEIQEESITFHTPQAF